MKSTVKRILGIVLNDYQFNHIYWTGLSPSDATMAEPMAGAGTIRPVTTQEQFAEAPDQRIREHAWYLDDCAHVYGVYVAGELVCVCSFWGAGHPGIPGRLPPLQRDEAVMVDLLTAAESRGKGYALAVSQFAKRDLLLKGYTKLWAWVWHNNASSMRVFDKAGWNRSHLLLEFQLHGMKDYLRMQVPAWGNQRVARG